jgi:hypothetical protein
MAAPVRARGTQSQNGRPAVFYGMSFAVIGFRTSQLPLPGDDIMIRKLKSGEYRLYSRKVDSKTGKRRNLGTFSSRQAAQKHERAVQFFKHKH